MDLRQFSQVRLLAALLSACSLGTAGAVFALQVTGEDEKIESTKAESSEKVTPNSENPDAKGAGVESSAKSESTSTLELSSDELKLAIQDLISPKFATRQAASKRLVMGGAKAMQAVAKAANSDDLELVTRCLSVLTDGLASSERAVQEAARSGLEDLVKSEKNSVAQRAKKALETPQGPLPGAMAQRVGGGQRVAVQVRVNNGNREINIAENGKSTVIKDENGRNISISVTETVNGKVETKTATAENEEVLKKNHPEMHAIYQKHTQGNRIGVPGIQVNGAFQPIPPAVRIRRFVNPIKAADAFEELDQLRLKIDAATEKLGKAIAVDKPDVTEIKAQLEEIKEASKRLGELKGEAQ